MVGWQRGNGATGQRGALRIFYLGWSTAHQNSMDFINSFLHAPEDIRSRLVLDPENPEYVFVFPFIYTDTNLFDEFKKYYYINKDSDYSKVFIYHSGEAIEPDLNIFDYAATPCSAIQEDERICRIHPNIYWLNSENYINTFTYQDALNKVKNNNLKFCNFIYSNPNAHPIRDQLFYKLSEYKRVDSLGPHLNNVNTQGSRRDDNWQQISVDLKSNYKFTIAVENAQLRGYTTEKLLTSFQAHTVPIYFGNPNITEEYNPEAFINFYDYENLDSLMAKIKEIDEDDELWAKMVSAPWQTEAQLDDYNKQLANYHNFLRKIFAPTSIEEKIKRPVGTLGQWYRYWFFNRKEPIGPIELKLRQIAQKILISLGLLGAVHNILKKLGLREE